MDLNAVMTAMMNDPAASQAATQMMALDAEMLSKLIPIFLGFAGFTLISTLITFIAIWKILLKAGQPGWKLLIPIYGEYTLFKICWHKKYFWATVLLALIGSGVAGLAVRMPQYESALSIVQMLVCIPIVAISLKAEFKMARAFGKGAGFGIGLILLPWIFYPILGFGKAKFRRRKRRRKIAAKEA